MICRTWHACAVLCLLAFSTMAFGQQDSSQSLADVARKLRKETSDEVRMTDADTKRLFESVDKIFTFASEDSGMPKHASVKRRLVSKADVEKYASGRLAKEEYAKQMAQAELTMKKLGFLPREFNLKEFLVKATGAQIAGYYDDETKMISLLNWVPVDHQEPILAHELTHALQDQNYDLAKWMKAAAKSKSGKNDEMENDDSAVARKAVVEGQAMVVYVDYVLAPMGRNLTDTPGLIYSMEEPAVKAVQDSQMMHDAPMILREAGSFAYNEGLIFEGELLHKGGKKMAFAGAFARPPRNSHEILQPEAYINGEKLAGVSVPDLKQLIGEQYDVFDSGGIGQLDVRAYLKQYGERRNADDVSSAWQGGAYVAFRRKDKAVTDAATTADLATIYISRWKTSQAAERFARFYASAVPLRYHTATAQPLSACSGKCPLSSAQFVTEEGPVIVEHWADNSVIVSESFDTTTALKIRDTVRTGDPAVHAENVEQHEIGLRLYEIPAFQRFSEQVGAAIALEMTAGR
ncbi:MAG TPA: hypothetical protein VE377_04540 [Candidatus Dormibacteraeota bacterium]|nr:hypothetical protein [Candidatus Dormibacteraeota bacterium]